MTTREKLFPPFTIEKSQNLKKLLYPTFGHSLCHNVMSFAFWNVQCKGIKIEFFVERFFFRQVPFR